MPQPTKFGVNERSSRIKLKHEGMTRRGPLIPSSLIDVPTQRLAATTVFLILQFFKCVYAVSSSSLFYHFLFTTLDVGFLWLLPYFAIPWLTFRPSVNTILISVVVLADAVIFTDPAVLASFVNLMVRVLWGLDVSLDGYRVPSPREHNRLMGQYVVSFLPESSAMLNVQEQLCLKTDEEGFLQVTLNATKPSKLQLAGLGFDDVEFIKNFTATDLSKLPSRNGKQPDLIDIWLPVTTPGYYRLDEVQDASSGLSVRTSGDIVLVPPCPTAAFPSAIASLCDGDPYNIEVEVFGLAPITITLTNGTTLTSDKSDDVYEPVHQVFKISAEAKPGQIEVGLQRVADAVGNAEDVDIRTQAIVHSRPSASLASGTRDVALTKRGRHFMEVNIDGSDGPFELSYFVNDTRHVAQLTKGLHNLPVSQPGLYKLGRIKGQVCEGEASGELRAFVPPMVQLSVDFERLTDKCAGPTGTDAKIVLQGTPPFKVWYRIVDVENPLRKIYDNVLSTDQRDNLVHFKPQAVGTFRYEVYAVQDVYNKIELTGKDYYAEQTISEIAGASFGEIQKTKYCPGERVQLPVWLQGKAKFDLYYILNGEERSLKDLDLRAVLDLDVLPAGPHRVTLTRIVDGKGCETQLNVASPELEVRQHVPRAAFSVDQPEIMTTDANINLPLAIEHAKFPARLGYTLDGGEIQYAQITGPFLRVSAPGTYKLVSINDECEGVVAAEPVSVGVWPRPMLQIRSKPQAACLGEPTELALECVGTPPFVVWHRHLEPGHEHGEVTQIVTDNRTVVFRLGSRHAGDHTHFLWLADSNYPESGSEQNALKIHHKVHHSPSASFVHKTGRIETCFGGGKDFNGIPMVLNGQSPFVLEIETQSGRDHRKQLFKVTATSSNHLLTGVVEYLQPGEHLVRVAKIQDANGCQKTYEPMPDKAVKVKVLRLPKLALPESPRYDYCVGDEVQFALVGEPPFALEYVFNNERLSAQISSHTFRRLAAAPGSLTFSRVRDAFGCVNEFANDVARGPYIVHDLPLSRVTKQRSFRIHAGDEVDLSFAFTGEPPFTVTYTRTFGSLVERHTIRDISTVEHNITVKDEGTYRVVALSDHFCSVVEDGR